MGNWLAASSEWISICNAASGSCVLAPGLAPGTRAMTRLGFRGYSPQEPLQRSPSAIAKSRDQRQLPVLRAPSSGLVLQRLLCQVHAHETLYLSGLTLVDALLASVEPCGRGPPSTHTACLVLCKTNRQKPAEPSEEGTGHTLASLLPRDHAVGSSQSVISFLSFIDGTADINARSCSETVL